MVGVLRTLGMPGMLEVLKMLDNLVIQAGPGVKRLSSAQAV